MKTRVSMRVSFLITLTIAMQACMAQAQTDSIVQLTAEAYGLTPAARADLPRTGTFWEVLPGGIMAPAPTPPGDTDMPVYGISDTIFLVDATGGQIALNPRTATSTTLAAAVEAQGNAVANLIEQVQGTQLLRDMTTMSALDLQPLDASGGTYTPMALTPAVDYGTNLWVAPMCMTNEMLTTVGSNTLTDVPYEILSRTNLAQTDWQSEGFVYGAALTNWTPLNVAQNGRANLFIRLRSGIDSANIGIPDWWQLQYFGYIGIDPYADLKGDGYSIYYKYQNGLNPTNFITPPGPGYFVAVVTNATNVLLTWSFAQGAVANYSIVRGVFNYNTYDYDYSTIATVGATTNSFLHRSAIQTADNLYDFYELTANYPGGNTSYASWSYIYTSANPPPAPPAAPGYDISVVAKLIRNVTGGWELRFTGLPGSAASIRLYWTDTNGNATTQVIATNLVANGIYQIPNTDMAGHLGHFVSVQGVGAGGESGQITLAGTLANDAPYFVDGRQHAKQNLNFLLQAAAITKPFGASYWVDWFPQFNQSTNFEEFGFIHRDRQRRLTPYGYGPLIVMDNLWPFAVNSSLWNYLLDTTRTNGLVGNTNFSFQLNFGATIPVQPVLGSHNPFWIYQPRFNADPGRYNATNWGVNLPNNNTVAQLQSGSRNVYGLTYQTGCAIDLPYWIDPATGDTIGGFYESSPYYQPLAPGDSITALDTTNYYAFGAYASQCSSPSLQLTNYYFVPLANPHQDPLNLPWVNAQPFPLPVDDGFNITNQTPPAIIAAAGEPVIIAGWAKYAIANGYTGKFAYLGQYFVTNALLLDNNGNVTTNSAGILSPYGEFFPTQAGKAQLVTMPDIDPPYQQGTCTVSIVSLNVDANHDGTMDLSCFGPDQTSASKPYVFWCNNDFDRVHQVDGNDIEQDDLPDQPTPDYDYAVNGARQIPCIRDLEDYSRLWITGVTTNLLTSLPAGSTVTLSWGDVGNPNSGNPTIDLFQAADIDGGMGYLTNSSTAAVQTNNTVCWYIGRLAPGDSRQLNAIQFNDFWAGNHFVWCGVTNGSGKLSLTFADVHGNILGSAGVWIQIKDIKQMYERWTVGDNGNNPPQTTARIVEDGFQYGPANTNTPYILHVHGWNMFSWEKDRFAETEFKRLYWQGYQGRFGEFRWPTFAGFPLGEFSAQAFDLRNFDNSESNAWASAVGLLNKLTDLNAQYPGQVYLTAHSMGNVVAGEALRLAGNNQVVNTYIAMQAAVSAHVYDPTTANRSGTFSTPDRYAQYYTNGASCYFNSSTGAGTYVNFFNTNDYALHSATFSWEYDQDHKPDNSIAGYPGYHYDVSSLYPNGFYVQFGSGANDFHNLNFPGDTYSIFAYCDQARSRALGAEAGMTTMNSGLNLQSVWPPDTSTTDLSKKYSAHKWHSAEFRSDSASEWLFWINVLDTTGFNLK